MASKLSAQQRWGILQQVNTHGWGSIIRKLSNGRWIVYWPGVIKGTYVSSEKEARELVYALMLDRPTSRYAKNPSVRPFGSNQMVMKLDDGREIFFSYSTPVAAYIPGTGFIRTEKRWSATTSKHISKYLGVSPHRSPHRLTSTAWSRGLR